MIIVEARIGDLAEQIRGVTYGKDDASSVFLADYLPVLRAGNITESGLTYKDLVYVPAARISAKQKIKQGDIIIAASSGSLDVVGKAARALNDFDGGFGAFCKVLRPNKKVYPEYFAQLFKRPEYRRTVSSLAAGANINNLRNEHLDDLRVPLPPLSEQRRIAAILDQADALRAKRREALAQLDSLTQSIFLEMFGDPARNERGWPITRLSALVASGDTINYGVVQPGEYVEKGVPLVRVGDLIAGGVRHDSLRQISPEIEAGYKRSRLQGDEILVSCVGTIGVIALVNGAEKGFNIARAVARIRLSGVSCRQFMAAQLQNQSVQRYFTSELRTVSQPTLNIKQICETLVMQPPLALQQTFAARIQSVEALKASHRAALQALDKLFASLQHRAFAGEL